MKKPTEIHFHGTPKVEALEDHIHDLVASLEEQHSDLICCKVHLEQPHRHRSSHAGWAVRVEALLPHLDISIKKASDTHEVHDNGYKVLDEAFEALSRKLRKRNQARLDERVPHADSRSHGEILSLHADHGFLRGDLGYEVYFHRNSVLGTDFADLREGMEVIYVEEEGDKGPQASSLRVRASESVPVHLGKNPS